MSCPIRALWQKQGRRPCTMPKKCDRGIQERSPFPRVNWMGSAKVESQPPTKVRYFGKDARTVAQALRVCDEIYYPNLYILLKIFSTIPSTSCECERSASALRRLSTYMRASMGQVRLSALAMIHIHYDTSISIEQAVDIFATMHPRKMQLGSVLAWLSLHKKVIMQTKEKVSRDIVFDIFNTEHMKIINV